MKKPIAMILAASVFPCAFAFAGTGFVTYEEFGAVGDGVADDQAAIVAAHAAANEAGLPVMAGSGRTYRIGGGAAVAVVRTDVDFGDARCIIDDTSPENRGMPVFRVEPGTPPIDIGVAGLPSLARGARELGTALPGRCHVELVFAGRRRYIRKGPNHNKGDPQREVVVADALGQIDPATPVLWDSPSFTRITVRPIDGKTLVVRGGSFTTIANRGESKYDYHSRGIRVERSNVRVCGLRHYVEGEGDSGAPYLGFLEVFHAADVTVEDCVFTAHRTYKTAGAAGRSVSMGSYDITVNNSANVVFRNCRQTTDILDRSHWGLFSSNYCKGLVFDGCVFSRFDAHIGVAGATIRNSDIGHMGINAIGSGLFLVENTRVRSESFFCLRGDYGSTWDGEFVVRNCVFAPPECGNAILVRGWNDGTHDFGYPCSMPRKVVFDGLHIEDSAVDDGVYLFGDKDSVMGTGREGAGCGEPAPFEWKKTEKAVLVNVTTTSGRDVRASPNPEAFGNIVIERNLTSRTP